MINATLRIILIVFSIISVFMQEIEWATLFVAAAILLKVSEDK